MIHKDLKWFIKLTYFFNKIDKTFIFDFLDYSWILCKTRPIDSILSTENYIIEYSTKQTFTKSHYLTGFYYQNYGCIDSILKRGLINYYKDFISEFRY